MLTRERLADVAGWIADDMAGGRTSEVWCGQEGIEMDAMVGMFESIERQFHAKVLEDGDVLGAVIDLTGQAFRLGWESRRTQTEGLEVDA